MDGAWGDYYHIILHTYGSWLPGNPRGFRTRHHREHVEGDYKKPPPKGRYERRHQHAKTLLRHVPVVFQEMRARRFVCDTFSGALLYHGIGLEVMSVSRVHIHLLAPFPLPPKDSTVWQYAPNSHNPLPRWVTGKAKSWTARQLKQQGYLPNQPGAVFGEKGKVLPIRDESHHHAVAGYIPEHAYTEDAAIWPQSQSPASPDAGPRTSC